MKLLCLIACMLGVVEASDWWFTAVQAKNGTQYIVGGADIPPYMKTSISRPLFIIENGNSTINHYYNNSQVSPLVAVVGVNDAKSLSLAGECLLVATESCLLAVTASGLRVETIAGDCMKSGNRNGPLLFARFSSLDSVAGVNSRNKLLVALLDSGRGVGKINVLFANSWSVRGVAHVLGAFDLSILTSGKEKSSPNDNDVEEDDVAILVLTPQSVVLIWGKDDNGGSGGNDGGLNEGGSVSIASGRWNFSFLASLNSTSSNNSSFFTSGCLQSSAYYAAYAMDNKGILWRWMVTPDITEKNILLSQVVESF